MSKLLILLAFTVFLISTSYAASLNYVCDGKKPHSTTGFFTPNTITETDDENTFPGRTRITVEGDYIQVINSAYRGTKGEMMVWNRINFAPDGKKLKGVFMSAVLTVKPFTNEVIDMFIATNVHLENCTVFYNPDVKKPEEPMPSKP